MIFLSHKSMNVENELEMHDSILGHLKSEVEPGFRLSGFVGCSPKVYSLRFCKVNTDTFSHTDTKIKVSKTNRT